MANALPILLLGGAALMLMGGKKKKIQPTEEPEIEPEVEGVPTATMLVEEPLAVKCQKFIDAIWVEPQPGELPIKSVVVEETILPEMEAVAKDRREKAGMRLGD